MSQTGGIADVGVLSARTSSRGWSAALLLLIGLVLTGLVCSGCGSGSSSPSDPVVPGGQP